MIATRQLTRLGLTRSSVEKRVRAGRLTPHIRGVYLVGPVMPPLGPESAALLACPGAVLSHLSAAALWGIAQRPDLVHIIAPTNKRRRKGLRPHRATVPPDETRTRQRLSLTSPYRTVQDLRRHMSAKAHKHVVWEASYRRLITDDQATDLLGTRTRKLARFEAERILVEILTGAGLPAPLTNQRLHGWEVDLYWPDHGVVVELDGFDAHGHRAGFERDHRKSLALEARGIHVLRVIGAQLHDEPTAIVATVAGALARRVGGPRLSGPAAG